MEERDVRVEDVRWVGDSTVAIDLETPPDFAPRPGQFVLVRATIDGEDHARHYTMSSPDAHETFELTVGVDPEGTLSGWLAERVPGDTITVQGPYGVIYYDGEPAVIVLAGGPGIGAGLGVLERAIAEGHVGGMVARVEGDRPHEDRLAALARADAPVYVCRSDAGVRDAIDRLREGFPDAQHFVFGFRPFVDEAVRTIEALGGDPVEAKIENYG